jgi:hypothetical protein
MASPVEIVVAIANIQLHAANERLLIVTILMVKEGQG